MAVVMREARRAASRKGHCSGGDVWGRWQHRSMRVATLGSVATSRDAGRAHMARPAYVHWWHDNRQWHAASTPYIRQWCGNWWMYGMLVSFENWRTWFEFVEWLIDYIRVLILSIYTCVYNSSRGGIIRSTWLLKNSHVLDRLEKSVQPLITLVINMCLIISRFPDGVGARVWSLSFISQLATNL
jgi:hypothetical protein